MVFKRSNGEFRETDRVTRFKLIKSGKNWLRAATSNFGLLKVIRGQVEETVVAEVREDTVSAKGMTSRHLLKGIVVAAAVLSATTVANTTFADEVGNEVVSSSTAVSAPSVSTEAASLTEAASKEVSAPQNETATETKPSVASSSEVVESAVASDDKAILEQNASEAALLNQIAEKYASNHQNEEQKAAIKEAVAKVQAELPTKEASSNSEVKLQSYAEQRSRLNKSVDDMMATLKDAGFNGNTTVNGAPAISAQLAPISTSTNGTTNPVITDPNGATIEDAAFNKAGYALDPNADRYTFGVWQFLKTNHATGAKTNFDYYATLAVDRSAITGSLSANPDVYLRIVKKSDGTEAYTRTIHAGESNISLPSYITNNNSDVTNTLTYTGANGTDPGNVTLSLVNANLEYETLQIRDTNFPGNEGEDKPNVQTSVPYATVDQTTHYKEVDSSKYTEGQPYKPTGSETDLASYTQKGLAGQQFTASGNREIPGYKRVAATTDTTQKTSGILGKGVVGQKLVELQGGANHYYMKRISEIVDTDGSTVTKFYALDPSQVNNFATSDIGTEDVSKYTLIYTSKVNKAGEEWKADETKVTKVNSKNGDYYLEVNETAGSKSLIITGWSSATETDTYKQMDGTLHTYPRPFKGAPSTSLTPAGSGNNSYNVIAGKVPEIQAEGSVANDPTAPTNGKVYSNLKGYSSFSNNYSIPTAIKPSTDVNYYFVKSDVKGNVYVHYQDTEGKTIKEDVTDEKDQPINKAYDTVVDNRPNEIQFEGKTYELAPAGNYTVGEVDDQGHLKSSDPTTGEVAKDDQNVTYIYKLKEEPKGNVYVHYKDTEGNTIKDSVKDEDEQPIDKDYDTVVDNRPKEIEKDGKTYELVPAGTYTVGEVDDQGHLTSSDPTTGKVAEKDKNVTYIYKLKEEPAQPKGNVYVHYKDTEGNTIKDSVKDEDEQPIDKDYDTVVDNRPKEIEKDGKTYELVPAGNYTVGEVDDKGHLTSSDPTTGKVAEKDKNVTYIYKLKEEPAEPKKGEVIITYVDENGKEIEKPRQDTPNSPYDTTYNTTEEGEKPNTIKTPDGKTYKIVPKGDYPVGKVDEDGHLESSDPVKGKVDKPKSTITYVYKEVKGNVYVHYVDTEGKTIKSDVTDEKAQPVDKDYDTVVDNRPQEIEFEGKTYELVPAGNYTVGEVDDQGHLKSTDPTKGKVIEGDKNVTYVYKLKETPAEPKKGEVVITYVDENGKEIEKPRQDTPNSPYDTPYNTTEEGEKPNTIKTPDGKTYKIVPKGDYPVGKVDEDGHLESSDPVKGKVDKPKSTITYVYKEVKGNVYVHYVDTEGKKIKEDVTDEEAQPVDKDYDTQDRRPQEIEFEGKTYELVPSGNYTVGEVDKDSHLKSTDPTTGKVIEGDKNVTYVYKLKETPDKPVEPTPDKPVEPTPDKPVEPTPDKPVEPTPDKPVEPTPDKPVEPTPDKPVEPTPDKPVEPTPDKPVEPTPDKPVEPTPDKPVEPTPDKPVEPTPDKPVNPTPDKPVDPTPGKPVDPTPGKPVDPTPGKPVNPTPGKPVDPTPGKPVDPTPGKPVNPTPGKPVDPTPAKEQLPNTGETTSVGSTVLGLVAGLVGIVAFGRRKKEDEK